MWNKIKTFFKKFWGLVFVPIGLFLAHLFFSSNKSNKKEIKEEKKEVKQQEKVVREEVKKVEKQEIVVEEKIEGVKKIIKENLKDKAVRDEKANKYLPNI